MMPNTSKPLVSICMPSRNASKWIGEAIESALAQTWEDFELVIADNASTDSTLEIARSYADPRIRVVPSSRNIGPIANHNRVIRSSSGPYIKFLHADDTLAPGCIEAMVKLALEDDRIGLVFAPREVLFYDLEGAEWARMNTSMHQGFSRLEQSNEGRVLFIQLVAAGIQDNWIGEPSAVLLSRSCLEQSGLFNMRLRLLADLELWMRIMLTHRIGFIDELLCVFRHHGESATATNAKAGRDWLDRLWMLEGLLESGALGPTRVQVERLRQLAFRRALRSQLVRIAKGRLSGELPAYLRYRARAGAGRKVGLHERLDDDRAGSEHHG